ncbi:MAG: hypothetical protein H6985_05030 [Pseudomonadales bacterium]|nr:hypothetical protein [Pseudomonadales bacterium]
MTKKSTKNLTEKIQSRFLKDFRRVRDRYKRYNSHALVASIVDYLYHNFELRSVEQLRKAPWVQLLLVKWILIDSTYNNTKKRPTQDQALEVMNRTWKLSSKVRLPNEYPDSTLFLRSMAFQQFIYQMPESLTHLAREKILFQDLPIDHPLQTRFLESTGLSIRHFMELSFVIIARYHNPPGARIQRGYFANIEQHFPPEAIDSYMALISADMVTLRAHLKESSPPARRPTEYAEQSPLHRFPFLKVKNDYLCWYPTILFRCLESFVYDYLREGDPQDFMDKFGPIFEKYVGDSIANANANYSTESDLKAMLSPGKLVDFAIREDSAIIFIDAKGVGLAERVKGAHDPKLIRDRTKGTVLKAIEQALAVHQRLVQENPLKFAEHLNSESFAIVVTYKEHFLSSGERIYHSIAREAMDRLREVRGGPHCSNSLAADVRWNPGVKFRLPMEGPQSLGRPDGV